MNNETKEAIAKLLRTISDNAELTARNTKMIADLLDPPVELPESSRSSHYS